MAAIEDTIETMIEIAWTSIETRCRTSDPATVTTTPTATTGLDENRFCHPCFATLAPDFVGRSVMKWAGMYLVGFVVLIGGLLAALWKLGILQSIGTTWTLIGVAILLGIGIMISVSHSGKKENIEIDRK
jgi:hypothetical protein